MLQTQSENKINPKLASSFGGTVEKDIPDNVGVDPTMLFTLKRHVSVFSHLFLKEPLGQHFITGATKDGVAQVTRWHLMCLQDGSLQDYSRVINSGVVGGKL